jgi:hypothetical protein
VAVTQVPALPLLSTLNSQEVSPAANRCRTAAGVAQQAQVATAVVQWLKTPPVLGALSLIPTSIIYQAYQHSDMI